MVKIRHSGGLETWYLHLASFAAGWPTTGTLVNPIQVDQGRYLGEAGSTGACAVHLHMELVHNDGSHASWDGQFIDGWTVHMDCGSPFVPDCATTNYNGYMSMGSTTRLPCGTSGCPAVTIGPSTNLTYTPLMSQTVTLQSGGTSSLVFAVNTGDQRTHFSWHWGGSTVNSWLISPDGTTIDPSTSDPNVVHGKDATSEFYDITNPQTGQWTLYSFGADIPAGGESVSVEAGSSAPPPVSVGGIAEQPDTAAVPLQTSTAAEDHRRAYTLGGAAAAAFALVAVGGWATRRRRSE